MAILFYFQKTCFALFELFKTWVAYNKSKSPFYATLRFMRLSHSMRFLLQVTQVATGFLFWSAVVVNYFRKNGKPNCDFKRIYRINYMFMNLHKYVIFCAANANERLHKNAIQMFSVNLSSIFLLYKLINSKEMTLST